MPTSSTWVGHSRFPPWEKKPVDDFLASLHLDSLSIISNNLRGRTDCIVNTEIFSRGREHVVFELLFGDNTEWVARVPLSHRLMARGIEEMRSEITTIQFLCDNTCLPIPRIHAYDLDPSNTFGAPYVLMDAVPGVMLGAILPDIPENTKAHVYRQLAQVMVELSRLLRWEKIGFLQLQSTNNESEYSITTLAFEDYHRIPAVGSSKEFYRQRAELFLDRKRKEGNPEGVALAWLYREAIPHFLQAEYEKGPFPLRHPDFSSPNVLFDESYTITGIIDWTATQASPWEQFARLPHEFNRRGPPNGEISVREREWFIRLLEEEESKGDVDVPMTKFIRSKAGRIAELVDQYYGYLDTARLPMEDIRDLISLIYGEHVTWEDIKKKAIEEFPEDVDGTN